jgi:hypothetical protein
MGIVEYDRYRSFATELAKTVITVVTANRASVENSESSSI